MIRIKQLIFAIPCVLFFSTCKENGSEKPEANTPVQFNQALADRLEIMAKVDQIAADIPKGKNKELSSAQWNTFKDSVFTTHEQQLQEMFATHGFLGYDLVGEAGSSNFWLMVQHSDHNPAFQIKVLEQMKVEVDRGNADSRTYGLLLDRVKLNTGEAQVYGTQVRFNLHTGQAYPKTLADSAGVNARRRSIGLEPLEDYLNSMSAMHFEMNKELYMEQGITEPKMYSTPNK